MADNVHRITDHLGVKVAAQVPETGGGAFGAARLAQIVAALQTRPVSADGHRTDQPIDAERLFEDTRPEIKADNIDKRAVRRAR